MPAPLNRTAWLLKRNRRYAPLLDTALKLASVPVAAGAALALPVLFLLNGYLIHLNQPAVPVGQAGDWVFLLLFGMLTSISIAIVVLLSAAWTTIVRWNVPGMDDRTIREACAATAVVTLGAMIAYGSAAETASALGILMVAAVGGLAGGLAARSGAAISGETAVACLGFGACAMLVELWAALMTLMLGTVLRTPASASPTWMTIGLGALLVVILAASIVRPAIGVALGVVTTGYVIAAQLSPDGGHMIASALYSAGVGGGRPAQTEQPANGGEICNLGVGERPVIYLEVGGCTRDAAFRRLRQLEGKGSLERRVVIRCWKEIAGMRGVTKACAAFA